MKKVLLSFLTLLVHSTLLAQPVAELISYDVPLWPAHLDDPYYKALERKGRDVLFKQLITDVKEKKTKAYFADEPQALLTTSEIEAIIMQFDTQYVEMADPPHDLQMVIVTEEVVFENIKWVRFYERWDVDSETGQLTKKIVGISPVRVVLDKITGEVRGAKPLYIIKYEDFKLD